MACGRPHTKSEDRAETGGSLDPSVLHRSAVAVFDEEAEAIALFGDDEFQAFDDQAHGVVDEALAFAKNGTDPAPEDALKNVYA